MTAPKGSPTRTKRPPPPGLIIARNTFDPDALAQQCAHHMVLYNDWAELNELGVRFLSSMRQTEIRELWPGAAKAAESDPQIGWLLKRARTEGFTSKSTQVLNAIELQGLQQRNTSRKKELRKARNTRPAREFAAAVSAHIERSVTVAELVSAGSTLIDRDVRATPDCRDVAVEWPHRLVGNMPVPRKDPHNKW